jgi:hypothetical protein
MDYSGHFAKNQRKMVEYGGNGENSQGIFLGTESAK